MIEKDLNQVVKVEKAIKDKYGEEAIQNPKGSWSKEKEQKYLKDLKNFYKNTNKLKKIEQLEGFTLRVKNTKHIATRTCPICDSYSLSNQDDVYMTKFKCCFKCYIQYIEDREERWKSGWRPNN